VTLFKRQGAVLLTLFLAGCGAGAGGGMSAPLLPLANSGAQADGGIARGSLGTLSAGFAQSAPPQTLFVSLGGSDSTWVAVYKAPFTSTGKGLTSGGPVSTICCDLGALVLDARGNLFTLSGGRTLEEYALPYTGSPTSTSLQGFDPVVMDGALALNASRELFVPDIYHNKVLVYTPPYTGAPLETITKGIDQPIWLGFDGAGHLFVENEGTALGSGTITEYASPYTGTPMRTITNIVNYPDGYGSYPVTVDVSGNLFITSGSTGNSIREYEPPYMGFPKRTINGGLNYPIGLTVDQNDDLFVSNNGNSTVTEYVPPYAGFKTIVTLSGSESWLEPNITISN
jgi:NHL repeat